MDYCVYLLYNTNNNSTYIGCTNNKERRIRQHNGELVGGAKYTTAKKLDGEWKYYGIIKNLNKNLALSIEKKIQKKSRKSIGKTTLERRLFAINYILQDYNEYNFEIIHQNQNQILL